MKKPTKARKPPNNPIIKQILAATVFNEWMRRYIEEPERFERDFQSVTAFLKAEKSGAEPDYGTKCVVYFNQLTRDIAFYGTRAKKTARASKLRATRARK